MRKEDYFDDWAADHEAVFADAYSEANAALTRELRGILFTDPQCAEKRIIAYAEFGKAIDRRVSDAFDDWYNMECACGRIDRQEAA